LYSGLNATTTTDPCLCGTFEKIYNFFVLPGAEQDFCSCRDDILNTLPLLLLKAALHTLMMNDRGRDLLLLESPGLLLEGAGVELPSSSETVLQR
jgi:hypothetical protein